ncbi:MAG: baseplate J/gp47 family protein [Cohaesibacter sp.]|jgi:phage-related baseplate assembly protein|nr:baseplate J/gp47 family protein [Cohaesibacter sp.]
MTTTPQKLIKALSLDELIKRGAPKVFTTSAAEWKAKMVAWFETSEDGPKRKLFPAQYEMLLIDMLAYCFSLLGQEAQAASEQRWSAFAKGKHLDVVAANNSTFRLKDEDGNVIEEDDPLRYRTAHAHDRISKAGPKESYRQQARAFSVRIIDVAVTRPEPGKINIYPLLDTGVPDAAFCAGLLNYLDPEGKRPQGDELAVLPPELVTFSITGKATVKQSQTAVKADIEQSVLKASSIWQRKLADYVAMSAPEGAAKAEHDLVDIELGTNGLINRKLDEHQFATVTSADITIEVV